MRVSLFAPFQRREPVFDGGEPLLDCSRGIASKHALAGKEARQFVEARVCLLAKRLELVLAEVVKLLTVIGEFPTELLEQAQRVALRFGHVVSRVRHGENRSDAK